MSNSLQSLRYSRGSLSVIDQLKLPHELVYVDVKTAEDAWSTIRTMQVRGAPLIAIVAALGLAVHVDQERSKFGSAAAAADFLRQKIEYLRTSRPTAVNLFRATDELLALVNSLASSAGATVDIIVNGYIEAAEAILAADVATNKAIGDFGAKRILEITGKDHVKVLTICNTGSLATAGYGTALGVIRSLHAMGKLEHVYACETRPYNQGARLTAFEIVQDGLPGTLIADSMASALMGVKGVDCVVVGADRVAANGDTANKIGTCQLAIAAKYFGIPFFAAVPTTTLDLTMASGAEIHVEERPADELTSIFGQQIAPSGIQVWNPSFDVTPCSLIRGVITEVGVAEAAADAGSDGIIDIAGFLRSKGLADRCQNAASPTAMPTGYQRLDEARIAEYIARLPSMRAILGISSSGDAGKLTVSEVGDGNLNFVYIISGPSGNKVVAKQALPYVRCVGESWPLTLQRATFEYNALVEEKKLVPQHVPQVYHFDKNKALIVMEYIAPPNQILRKALIQGLRINSFAAHLGSFLAKTLYGTSALALEGGALRLRIAEWSQNTAMCALTEKVIFTDPYTVSPNNRWTTPQLDDYAEGVRNDEDLHEAINNLKAKFLGSPQALVHADLHSGSVMASEGVTFVIDPEFGFYGPMGFDIGALIANLLLSYFSQAANNGTDYAEWVLQQAVALHDVFQREFLALWDDAVEKGTIGELYKTDAFLLNSDSPRSSKSGKEMLSPRATLSRAQSKYLASIWRDTLGFAGAKMIRRVVGIAHVADLDSIADADARSVCEKRALLFGRQLVIASQESGSTSISDIRDLAAKAKAVYSSSPSAIWPY